MMNTPLLVVGILLMVLGIGAYVYAQSETNSYFFGAVKDTNVTHPYRGFGLPIAGVGLILVVVGAVLSTGNKITG